MPVFDLILAAMRRDADTAPVADGATHPLATNAVGRLKTSTLPAAMASVTGTLAALNQTVVADVSRISNVVVEVTGTLNMTVMFQSTIDGVNWKADPGVRSSGNIVESSAVLAAAPAYTWEISVNGKTGFRVLASAYTSGTANVTIGLGAFATEPFATTQISGQVGISSLTPGTSATNLGKAEDAAHTTGDVGVMALGVRNDNVATARSSANGDYDALSLDANGAAFVRDRPFGNSAVTSVAASATSVSLLAVNTARRGATVYNDSSAILYLKLGATASTSSFTTQIAPGGYYEVPFGYVGAIDGIWASAVGNARITDIS